MDGVDVDVANRMNNIAIKKTAQIVLAILFLASLMIGFSIFNTEDNTKNSVVTDICDLLELAEGVVVNNAQWQYLRTDTILVPTNPEKYGEHNDTPTLDLVWLFSVYLLQNQQANEVDLYFDRINRIAIGTPHYEEVFSWEGSPPEEQEILFERETLPGQFLIREGLLGINLWPTAKEGVYEHCIELKDGSVYRTKLVWTAPLLVNAEVLEENITTSKARVSFEDVDISSFEFLFYINPSNVVHKVFPTGNNFIDIPLENGQIQKGQHSILFRKNSEFYTSSF
ncbi:MAG: hypothetical protein WDZ40_01495 [Candidatus Spechtbacterales bacterium]